MGWAPSLSRVRRAGIELLSDERAARRGIVVAFTNRRGGVSRAPFDTLNIAARVGDDQDAVRTNRKRVATAVGFDLDRLALARQVHAADGLVVGEEDAGVVGEADYLVARAAGPVLGILTADCAPVVIAGGGGISVVHAGWRGVVAGVVEAGARAIAPAYAAWVGPSIHSCCYEVGPEVVEAFRHKDLPVAAPDRVDPAQAARAVLHREGVPDVAVSDDCTACDARYFSYRRSGTTGRQGGFAYIMPER